MFVQKHFPSESLCMCTVPFQTPDHTLLPPGPCSHPLPLQTPPVVLPPLQEHPSKVSSTPALFTPWQAAARAAGEGSQQVRVRIKSGDSSIHSPLHPSVPTLLCSRHLLLLFPPTRPLHLCSSPFQSLPSELAFSPLCLPLVPHQSPLPTKHSAPTQLF